MAETPRARTITLDLALDEPPPTRFDVIAAFGERWLVTEAVLVPVRRHLQKKRWRCRTIRCADSYVPQVTARVFERDYSRTPRYSRPGPA